MVQFQTIFLCLVCHLLKKINNNSNSAPELAKSSRYGAKKLIIHYRFCGPGHSSSIIR